MRTFRILIVLAVCVAVAVSIVGRAKAQYGGAPYGEPTTPQRAQDAPTATAAVTNAQTTQPMATPSDGEIANLKERADEANAICDKAKRQVIAKVEQTDEYKQANEDLKSAQETLDDTGNTAEYRMQAAADKAKAKGRVQKLIDDALAADPQIVSDAKMAADADAEYKAAVDQKQAAQKIVEAKAAAGREILEAKAAAERERKQEAAIDAAFTEVTFQQVNTLGERYAWKPIRIKDITFSSADNGSVDQLPGVTLAENGLEALINTKEAEKWIGFSGTDSDGTIFTFLYADKAIYGDFVAGIKKGRHISIRGVVVPLNQAGWYGIVCSKITVTEDAPPDSP